MAELKAQLQEKIQDAKSLQIQVDEKEGVVESLKNQVDSLHDQLETVTEQQVLHLIRNLAVMVTTMMTIIIQPCADIFYLL